MARWTKTGNVRGPIGPSGEQGPPGAVHLPFTMVGPLFVRTGTTRYPIQGDFEIVSVAARVGTLPVGASVVVNVNRNDASIYADPLSRPTITVDSDGLAVTGEHTATSIAEGDYLSVDVDQVGSEVAGADLVVVIVMQSVLSE